MEIEIVNCYTKKPYGKITVTAATTFGDLKELIHQKLKSTPHSNRQSLRLEPRGKSVKDTDTLQSQNLRAGDRVYVKDLGPQIGWKTVFLAEYAGPLIVYLLFYTRPELVYGVLATRRMTLTTHIAAACYTVHYVKRLLETIFVHRFSHATMPLRNLFKNCAYYWGFTAYVSYHVNHPQFISPCMWQVWAALFGFVFCELGNFSIHIALRNLRPPGTKVRKIPVPDRNCLTSLFNVISCPNYTYEIGAWLSFSVMTSCLSSFLFAIAGAYQMTVWALAKHRNYRKEFKDYPKDRYAIFPLVI